MVNKNKWIYNFNNLAPENQLIVAEAIKEELEDNEYCLDDEDNYNKEEAKIVKHFFEKLISNTKKSEELEKIRTLLNSFETLTKRNQTNIINKFAQEIKEYQKIEEQQNKEEICQREGHEFKKWHKRQWTTYEEGVIDHQFIHRIRWEHEEWIRECNRCGFVERSETRPKTNRKTKKNK